MGEGKYQEHYPFDPEEDSKELSPDLEAAIRELVRRILVENGLIEAAAEDE